MKRLYARLLLWLIVPALAEWQAQLDAAQAAKRVAADRERGEALKRIAERALSRMYSRSPSGAAARNEGDRLPDEK